MIGNIIYKNGRTEGTFRLLNMLRTAVFVIFTLTGTQAYDQKVCRTWFDYYVRPFSKNCWYEADVGKNIVSKILD